MTDPCDLLYTPIDEWLFFLIVHVGKSTVPPMDPSWGNGYSKSPKQTWSVPKVEQL